MRSGDLVLVLHSGEVKFCSIVYKLEHLRDWYPESEGYEVIRAQWQERRNSDTNISENTT